MSINRLTAAKVRERAPKRRDQLGWCGDGFVLPHALVTPDDVEPLQGAQPTGDVQSWSQAISAVESLRLRFAVLAGFGSVLFPRGVNSAVVSLVGPSGTGKTTAAKLALSIYGDPDLLMQGGQTTTFRVEKALAHNRHLPYLLDEVTQYRPRQLADIVFLMANGMGSRTGTWSLTPFLTSNRPLLEIGYRSIHEAHRRRLLELRLDEPLTIETASQAVPAWTTHFGTAAPVFLQEAMRAPVPFTETQQRVAEGLPPENRFGIWTLTAALVAGNIAKQAGLIDWDCEEIINEVAGEVRSAARGTLTEEDRARQAVAAWVADNEDRIENGDGRTRNPVMRRMKNGSVAAYSDALYESMSRLFLNKPLVDRAIRRAVVERRAVKISPHDTKEAYAVLFDITEVRSWNTNVDVAQL